MLALNCFHCGTDLPIEFDCDDICENQSNLETDLISQTISQGLCSSLSELDAVWVYDVSNNLCQG